MIMDQIRVYLCTWNTTDLVLEFRVLPGELGRMIREMKPAAIWRVR